MLGSRKRQEDRINLDRMQEPSCIYHSTLMQLNGLQLQGYLVVPVCALLGFLQGLLVQLVDARSLWGTGMHLSSGQRATMKC